MCNRRNSIFAYLQGNLWLWVFASEYIPPSLFNLNYVRVHSQSQLESCIQQPQTGWSAQINRLYCVFIRFKDFCIEWKQKQKVVVFWPKVVVGHPPQLWSNYHFLCGIWFLLRIPRYGKIIEQIWKWNFYMFYTEI